MVANAGPSLLGVSIITLFIVFLINTILSDISLFTLHPWSMFLLFLFAAQSLLAIELPRKGVPPRRPVLEQYDVHWSLMMCGLMCAVFGLYIMYTVKERAGRAHFESLHALTGLAGLLAALVQNMAGLAMYSIRGKPEFTKQISVATQRVIWAFHRYSAVVVVGSWAAASILGVWNTGWIRKAAESNQWFGALLPREIVTASFVLFVLGVASTCFKGTERIGKAKKNLK
ncbi:hypothetical protein BJ742DRAFT_341316 [Cladochytrium replicatum]|nr:hypothetical protein BJ742DRAFT_341316 [Cladochytrium replicatum]